jgi:Zn-finger nucleic acid-binding protein
MKCPRCDVDLHEVRAEDDLIVNPCSECGGVWFDFADLSRILEEDLKKEISRDLAEKGPEGEGKTEGKIACPNCGGPLVEVKSLEEPHILMESCIVCYGRWIDGPELRKLLDRGILSQIKSFLQRFL